MKSNFVSVNVLTFSFSTASGTASIAPGIHLQLEHVSISVDTGTVTSARRVGWVFLAAIPTTKTTFA